MKMRDKIFQRLQQAGMDLTDLLFPRLCAVCGTSLLRGEDVMCLQCRASLPVTGQYMRQPNDIHDRLISLKVPLRKATSYFYYNRENPYSKLVHDTKYRGRPHIGRILAADHARELMAIGFFNGIDALQPIPIHFLKRVKRGYNQSEAIAEGIAEVTGLPIIKSLRAATYHTTQTHKNAEGRRRNIAGSFQVSDASLLDGRHILLIDDVITTGSTMVEAMETIKRANNSVELSVFSLALTSNS